MNKLLCVIFDLVILFQHILFKSKIKGLPFKGFNNFAFCDLENIGYKILFGIEELSFSQMLKNVSCTISSASSCFRLNFLASLYMRCPNRLKSSSKNFSYPILGSLSNKQYRIRLPKVKAGFLWQEQHHFSLLVMN
jgi:hypothetical protein